MAGDLNDHRVAIGLTPGYVDLTARYDVTTSALIDTLSHGYTRINNAGQMVGALKVGSLYSSLSVITSGFTLPALPDGPNASRNCGSFGHMTVHDLPVDLDDTGNVLIQHDCFAYAYLSSAGSVWLDRYVGRPISGTSGIHLSRQGGIVASLDSTGTVYVWTAATQRVIRVQVTLGGVKLDELDGVNAAGQIVVHGTDPANGKGGAFLLSPETR